MPEYLRVLPGIIIQDLLLAPTIRQQVDDELDGQPGALGKDRIV